MANSDIPTGDDFLGVGVKNEEPSNALSGKSSSVFQVSNNSTTSIRHSFNLKRGAKSGSRLDYNYFDSKLIDRAMNLLSEYKKIYQFAVLNCLARPNLKKTSELLE